MALLSTLMPGRALLDVKLEVMMPGAQEGIGVGVLPGPLRGLIGGAVTSLTLPTKVITFTSVVYLAPLPNVSSKICSAKLARLPRFRSWLTPTLRSPVASVLS